MRVKEASLDQQIIKSCKLLPTINDGRLRLRRRLLSPLLLFHRLLRLLLPLATNTPTTTTTTTSTTTATHCHCHCHSSSSYCYSSSENEWRPIAPCPSLCDFNYPAPNRIFFSLPSPLPWLSVVCSDISKSAPGCELNRSLTDSTARAKAGSAAGNSAKLQRLAALTCNSSM